MTLEEKATRINAYRKALPVYGFLVLLYVMEEYKQEEKYEECECILKAVQYNNIMFGLDIPTEYNQESIDYFLRESYKVTGRDFSFSVKHIDYYAIELKLFVAVYQTNI